MPVRPSLKLGIALAKLVAQLLDALPYRQSVGIRSAPYTDGGEIQSPIWINRWRARRPTESVRGNHINHRLAAR